MTRSLRENQKIRGLKTRGQEFKLIAFADDLAIIVEDPLGSINEIKAELDSYSIVSGMKINYDKTKLLVKNMNQEQTDELTKKAQIQATSKIKHLGIHLTNSISALVKDNYEKLLREIEKDLNLWNNLQLSILGRIATVKMNILPRLLYLFQVIPVHLNIFFSLVLKKTKDKEKTTARYNK